MLVLIYRNWGGQFLTKYAKWKSEALLMKQIKGKKESEWEWQTVPNGWLNIKGPAEKIVISQK